MSDFFSLSQYLETNAILGTADITTCNDNFKQFWATFYWPVGYTDK